MNISRSRIIYLLLTVLTFIFFSHLLPLGVIDMAPYGFAIIASLIFTFFALQTLVDFKSWGEFSNLPSNRIGWRHKVSFFSIVPALIMVFVFHYLFAEHEKRELVEHGQLATGIAVDGFGLKTHRRKSSGAIYELSLKFKTKKGETVSVIENISEEEYNKVSKDSKVELIYSERDPSIVQLFLDDNTVKNFPFKGIEQRDIEVKDLQALVGLPNKELGKALNRISFKWDFEPKDSTWKNEVYDLAIASNYRDRVSLISFDISSKEEDANDPAGQFDKYVEQMEPLQLAPVESNDSVRFYGNGQYKASIEEIEKSVAGLGLMIGQKITIVKK